MRQGGWFRYIAATLSNLRLGNESKTKIRSRQGVASRFNIEQLEPRILLSGELAPQPEVGSAVDQPQLAATVLILESTNGNVETQSSNGGAADASQYSPNLVDFTIET